MSGVSRTHHDSYCEAITLEQQIQPRISFDSPLRQFFCSIIDFVLGGHVCGIWGIGCVGGKVCHGDEGTEVCGDVGVGTPGYGASFDPFGQPSNPRGTGSVGGFGEISFPGGSVGAEASYNPYGPDGMLLFSRF